MIYLPVYEMSVGIRGTSMQRKTLWSRFKRFNTDITDNVAVIKRESFRTVSEPLALHFSCYMMKCSVGNVETLCRRMDSILLEFNYIHVFTNNSVGST